MFSVDIETLSQKENAVILSCALTHFSEKESLSFEELVEKTCFVKFNAKEQVEKYNRKVSKSTLEWWKRQSDIAKEVSLIPNKNDKSVFEGVDILREYVRKYSTGKELVFCRGSLDQFVLFDLFEQLQIPQLFEYYQFRDYRTAIECLKENAEKGFCPIPNLDMNKVIPHHPVHDNCRDIMMLLS